MIRTKQGSGDHDINDNQQHHVYIELQPAELAAQQAAATMTVDDIPSGYRFCPKDEELIKYYLIPKLQKNSAAFVSGIIHEINIYDFSPDQLKSKYPSNRLYKENEWYFFTSRKRKYAHGTRPDRSTPTGYWKPTGAEIEIKNEGNKVIGYRKGLDYYHGHQSTGGVRTDWKMHEYRIHQTGPPPTRKPNGDMDMQLDEGILCRIYLNKRKKGDNEQEENAGGGGGGVQTNDHEANFVQNLNNNLGGGVHLPNINTTVAAPPMLVQPAASFETPTSLSFPFMFDQYQNSFLNINYSNGGPGPAPAPAEAFMTDYYNIFSAPSTSGSVPMLPSLEDFNYGYCCINNDNIIQSQQHQQQHQQQQQHLPNYNFSDDINMIMKDAVNEDQPSSSDVQWLPAQEETQRKN